MELATRTLVTGGVALLGAGMIVATPATPGLPDFPDLPTTSVQLTAGFDPITPWVEALQTAFNNSVALGTAWFSPFLPVLQQVIVNQAGFLHDFISNPGSIFSIFGEMWGNLVAGVSAPFAADPGALDTGHQLAFGALSPLLPILYPDNTELAEFLLNFSATPFSGWLFGEIGMFLSPWLELWDSITSAFDAVRDGDWVGVLNDVVNIPAHMVDGYLNGYGTIDLTEALGPLLPELPIGTIRAVSIDLPGMLNADGTGLLFGAIGMDVCTTLPIVGCTSIPPFPLDGTGTGPLGSLIDMTHSVARAMGWDGEGNPLGALFGAAAVPVPDEPAELAAVATPDTFDAALAELLTSAGA